ncbi:MAG: YggS family pyridoxal phosphate-dependent enzyme [Oscillospiraceae bacterium]|nr:YggS family pyridoxal phosphate-dependent enzyme [Oscillospiraceae bacterium]
MGVITENLKRINHNINEAKAKYRSDGDMVRLMAVTKTVSYEMVNEAVAAGVGLLGESRVQEFLRKKAHYDKSAEIHFIGHLQTNKVKHIIGEVSVIQSLGSVRLAEEVNERSVLKGIKTGVLIEVNIGMEDSKSGVSPEGLHELLARLGEFKNLEIKGLMAIPPPGNSDYYFGKVNELFLKAKAEHTDMCILSMGMSEDYASAIKHGANLVRIGSAIFGTR